MSQSATLDGDKGNTPTRQEYALTIDNNREGGNPDSVAAHRAVERLQSRATNALPLKVVDTFRDLPEHIKSRYRERKMTGGVRGVSDGKAVYLVADALESESQAVALWMHEQGIHHGLRGLVGDDARFNALMDSVFEHFGPDELDDIRQQYGLDFGRESHRREAAEEMLARIGEKVAASALTGQPPGWHQT